MIGNGNQPLQLFEKSYCKHIRICYSRAKSQMQQQINQRKGTKVMIKLGMVGAGGIGIWHKEALDRLNLYSLEAVCDIVIDRAKDIACGTNARVYADYKEMAEAEKLDAVILNLPHFLHKEVAVYFLERSIAVLVEKPMAMNVEECNAMIEASRKTNTPLAVGHVQRYFVGFRKLKEIVESGELGEFCQMTEIRNVNYFDEARPTWFLDKAKAGAGITMNYGAHGLDKLKYITGATIEKVTAIGSNTLNSENIEACSQLLLKLSGNASAILSYCGCNVPATEELTLYFTKGSAKLNPNSELQRELYISKEGAPYEKIELPYEKDLCFMDSQLEEFYKLLKGEKSDVVTPEYGRDIIRVLEDAISQF